MLIVSPALLMCTTVIMHTLIVIHDYRFAPYFRPVGNVLKLRMPNTQCQLNSFNCGVLTIATATKLALGKDPLLCYWDTAQMRCHLIQRLEQGKMESFS